MNTQCDETRSVDATHVLPNRRFSDKIGGLMNKCLRTAVEQSMVPRKSSKLGGEALNRYRISECLR
jgi:hypothetical protein